MKFTHGKLTVSVKDWLKNQEDYLAVLAFVHKVFKKEGAEIPTDIPLPSVRLIDFHYNTNDYLFCQDHDDRIYINQKYRGKKLSATMITGLADYYARNIHPANEADAVALRSKILDNMYVDLTLTELAITSSLVVGGVLAAKTILSKF